ncbi:TetR family transcriptional regulator [Arthrobacter crystallopoietes BAB-32]|uniref:TetR family transcriptional regulator n=1 Tax=Arthrobacter crystallopoietes BAB-32 TaxID=1246476 RepID=N1V4F0_9MICC|nr:TetR/AcrR family transcriptional regulator [Arthrobacter crystallopoietes]EMY34947.1 TetR family transcriptional regulator [Arthrobacter crystallopoietes BAB-32]
MLSGTDATAAADARERVLSAVYPLFAQRGVRDVGIEEIIRTAGVAKATFYRHFASKEALVLAFLQRRHEVFGISWLLDEVGRRADSPEERLLAIFDVFGEWFAQEDYEACSFIRVMFEMGATDPAGQASIGYLAEITKQLAGLAEEAGLEDVGGFARSWRILMAGSIVCAAEGDRGAAARAKTLGGLLIAEHRPERLPEQVS